MTVAAVDPTSSDATSSSSSPNSAYGLNFQSLLQIILTQLTYQDPLKPLDNFEFVSQLAQFSQLQQSQTLNTDVQSLVTAETANQAVGLIGHKVSLTSGTSGSSTASGSVTAANISGGTPSLTITTSSGQVLANVSLSSITTVQ